MDTEIQKVLEPNIPLISDDTNVGYNVIDKAEEEKEKCVFFL